MRIMNVEPANRPGGNGMRILAHFDAQVTPDIRLHGLRLLEAPDGSRCIYAAQFGARRSATFGRPLAEQITAAATQALQEAVTAHDDTTAKAA
jgi:hypothetical protein